MVLDLKDFPRFVEYHLDDDSKTWLESVRKDGYHSAIALSKDYGIGWSYRIEMDDVDFTHFVLRWS